MFLRSYRSYIFTYIRARETAEGLRQCSSRRWMVGVTPNRRHRADRATVNMSLDLIDDRAVALGLKRERPLDRRRPERRRRHRNDKLRRPAAFDRRKTGRLSMLVKGMVKPRLSIGRIGDRPIVKGTCHRCSPRLTRATSRGAIWPSRQAAGFRLCPPLSTTIFAVYLPYKSGESRLGVS